MGSVFLPDQGAGERWMHGTVHFGSVATGVARMSSDGNTDMRG